jgi:hypothetical protein
MNTSYKGFISIVDTKNNITVIQTDLNPLKSASRDNIEMTLFFMNSLAPGSYKLQLSLDTDAIIDKLIIHGPSSRETEIQGIEIKIEPPSESSYEQMKIDYVCGVNFSQTLVASALFGAGLALTVVGTFIQYMAPSIKTKSIISTSKVRPVKTKKK